MAVITETLGLLACLAPIVAIVLYLIWLSRRPSCPECEYGVSRTATTCPHCGRNLEKRDEN